MTVPRAVLVEFNASDEVLLYSNTIPLMRYCWNVDPQTLDSQGNDLDRPGFREYELTLNVLAVDELMTSPKNSLCWILTVEEPDLNDGIWGDRMVLRFTEGDEI